MRRHRPGPVDSPADAPAGFLERVYFWILRIPRGKVATYGQIARLAGEPRRARHVGRALAHPPEDLPLPWHRVINAQGRISPRRRAREGARDLARAGAPERRQRRLLEGEGVRFAGERVDLARHLWNPEAAPEWLDGDD